MQSVNTWIEKKEKEIQDETNLVKRIKIIQEKFPDLSYSIDRWEHFRLHSAEVNKAAVDFDIGHSCGCCSDSPIFVRPYVKIEGEKVYAVPERFCVGEKGYGCEIPRPGWRKDLLDAGIQQCIIEGVEAFFEANKAGEHEEEDIF